VNRDRHRSDADVDWSNIHSADASWRTRLLGDLSEAYAIPRYVEIFLQTFGGDRGLRFLEVGAGNGEVPRCLQELAPPCVGEYVVSELFADGARWLRSQNLTACVADAQQLPFADGAFDAVISYDVLHHVSDPYRMAQEMIRVSRGRLLLTESNGLSLGRKLMEQTAGHKAAGERSYTPWRYRQFFTAGGRRLCSFRIRPFLFPVPGGVPSPLLRPLIFFNRVIERVPFARWQCSNVWMTLEVENPVP
jgi:SAM-dependent methyltransferase|tara:strand:+ start:520 stop:1263 length:744 start_codon:yes stop_codon:yes gene_type:complete